MTSPIARTSSSASTFARNPVSLRLYKVLGTNFNDEATREALSTLSDLYASSNHSTTKNRSEDDIENENLGNIPGEPQKTPSLTGEVATRARRSMRRDMEHKLVQSSQQFLQALGEVDQVCVLLAFLIPPV